MDTRERIAHVMLIVFVLGMVCMLASTIAEGQALTTHARVEAPAPTPSGAGAAPLTDTQLWLARCLVGEEGWPTDSTRGHLALAWVLHKRAHQRNEPLIDTVHAYCKALTGRRVWIRHLPPEAGPDTPAPRGWPATVSWVRHRRHWRAALALAATYHTQPDPCPHAMHWGGRGDKIRPRQVPAECAAQGWTHNTLLAVTR